MPIAERRLVRLGKYEFSVHAEKERQTDRITITQLEDALGSCEVIEVPIRELKVEYGKVSLSRSATSSQEQSVRS